MEELIGIFLSHEQVLQGDVKMVKGRDIAFNTSHKEKKTTSVKVYEFV